MFWWNITGVAGIWFILVLQFFRDPKRETPDQRNVIISPADGKIIVVGDADANSPIPLPGKQISIFMSPFNVHVNRSPYDGVVVSREHTRGKFLSAFKDEASRENENNLVKLETEYGTMAFRQIAGFLARRIVFHPQPGDKLETGERVGMIRFGSRVDVFLPEKAVIKVKMGEKVIAGETVIGEFVEV